MPTIADLTTPTLPAAGDVVHLATQPASVGLFDVVERGAPLPVVGTRQTPTKTVLEVEGEAKDGNPTTYWLRPEHISDF